MIFGPLLKQIEHFLKILLHLNLKGGIELALSAQYALQRILLGYIDEQGNEVKPNTNTKQTKDVAPLKVGVLMYNMRNQ